MKVLFLASGQEQDYQCDVLFHGLRELLGPDVVDANRLHSLYEQSDAARHAMYGRGYTVYGGLDDIAVDRTDILAKIRRRHFDYVVYGSIQRCSTHLREVLKWYPPSRVAFVDGEDEATLLPRLVGYGVYFKREMTRERAGVFPIHFTVPADKFLPESSLDAVLTSKAALFAPCDPRDRRTYTFLTEESYYQQYRGAYFGITLRKAGWDCMRHHEIVAQGCAPYFLGLEQCPTGTLQPLRRDLLLKLRTLAREGDKELAAGRRAEYADLVRQLYHAHQATFTTTALAPEGSGSPSGAPVGSLRPEAERGLRCCAGHERYTNGLQQGSCVS